MLKTIKNTPNKIFVNKFYETDDREFMDKIKILSNSNTSEMKFFISRHWHSLKGTLPSQRPGLDFEWG